MNERAERWLAPLARLAHEALDARLQRVQQERARCAADPTADAVHDLRVAIRRYVQVLKSFAPVFGNADAKWQRRALRKPLNAAAVVRDLDVGMLRLLADGLDDSHVVIAEMREMRRRAALALSGRLLLLAAREPAQVLATRTPKNALCAGAFARAVLPELTSAFFAAGEVASNVGATPAALHKFRLAAKRFRYTLELFRPLYGPALDARIEEVRRVQALLGDRQDCAVLCARLRKRVDGDDALRVVFDKLDAQGRAYEAKFRRYWRRVFAAPNVESAWLRYFVALPPGVRAALPTGGTRAVE